MKLLLVEDDRDVKELLAEALGEEHYIVDVATDGETAWEFVRAFRYDLLILDVMIPKLDGINLCRRIRSQSYQMPIMLLTAKDTTKDKILGLDAGADDYVVKPYTLQELLARIRALLRRGISFLNPVMDWEELSLNPNTKEVKYGDRILKLTPKEYCLLELFMRNGSRVLSRSVIMENLWSFDEPPDEDAIKAHIKRLRQKLKSVGAGDDYIETVYGLGYRLKLKQKS